MTDVKKAAKRAAPAILTATTTLLPAAAAFAEEDVTPVDLKLAVGFTVALGIAAFSTLPGRVLQARRRSLSERP